MSYYTNVNSKKGTLNLSDYIFNQLASETLEDLASHELKDSISLKLARSRKNVVTTIDKNKVTIDVYFSALRNSDVNKAVSVIQQEIYDAVYEATEISTVKVNVSVVSFVDNK